MSNCLSNKKIKVLIVDDSALMRKLLNNILSNDSRFEVVAEATNGKEAVIYSKLFKPDVISMDMIMPIMDGLEATYEVMKSNPVPIVIVSSIYQKDEVNLAIQELEAGAVAIIQKPSGPEHPNHKLSANKYKSLLKIMSEIKVVKRTNRIKKSYQTKESNQIKDNTQPKTNHKTESNTNGRCARPKDTSIIAIGASAGGPEAIRIILESLTYPLKAPIIIIQHIDPNFTEGLAIWLQQNTKSNVKIAKSGERLKNNTIYISPGGMHLTIIEQSIIKLTSPIKGANASGHTPSIDVLFESLTKENPEKCIAILLSGMGKDGAEGLKNLKESGAYTLIQNETSSLIFGMPGEAEKLDAHVKKLTPEEIAQEINYIINPE